MTIENPFSAPDPELINRQPKWLKPALILCIIASVLFVIGLVSAPVTLRARKKTDQTEATSNARQVGLALFEFELEYGAFPNDTTAPIVTEMYPGHGHKITGNTSNASFRQLIAAEITQSEQMFYANVKGVKRPDGVITPGKALEKGEIGFTYIAGLSTEDDPSTPIVLTPLIPGTTKFDPKPHKGRAIILHIDNSVRSYQIHKDGHVYEKGINLLSPKHPVWNGRTPDIRYPE